MWVNSSSLGFRLVTYKVGIIKLRSWDNIHIHNKIPQCVLNKMYIYIASQLWRLQVQGQAVSGVGSLIAVRQKVLQCPLHFLELCCQSLALLALYSYAFHFTWHSPCVTVSGFPFFWHAHITLE